MISKEFIQIIDVETTGFDPMNNSLIVYSSIIAKYDTLDFCEQFTGYARPESKKYWSPGAEKIHKISYDEAMSFPKPRDAAIKWLKFLVPFKHKKNLPMLTIYHGNGNFDPRFAEAFFLKVGLVFSWNKIANKSHTESTIKLAKNHLDLENYKLNTVCEKLDIELDHHEAASDTRACHEIYKQLKLLEIK